MSRKRSKPRAKHKPVRSFSEVSLDVQEAKEQLADEAYRELQREVGVLRQKSRRRAQKKGRLK